MTARFHWLLDVEGFGSTLRYAVDGLEVPTADGDVIPYDPGLDEIEAGQGDVEVDVSIVDGSVDWPRIAPLLEGARCTLRRWREGTALEQAEVYARGTATETEWGAIGEPVEWTIRPIESLPTMPEPGASVSSDTTVESEVDKIPPGQSGMYYPTVFGFPGYRSYTWLGGVPFPEHCVPCPMRIHYGSAVQAIESEIVVSSDAGMFCPNAVYMREDASGYEALAPVKVVSDALGRRIAVATLAGAFGLGPAPGDAPKYLAAIHPAAGGQQAPRNAYDVVTYALTRWGGDTVDWARIPECRSALIGYNVDIWVTDAMEAPDEAEGTAEGGVWRWLVEALGVGEAGSVESAGLPVAIRLGSGGRYLQPLRYTTDPARTRRTIDVADGDVDRESSIRVVGKPANAITVEFGDGEIRKFPAYVGLTPAAGAWSGSKELDALLDIISRTPYAPSGLADASAGRYGRRELTIPAPWTWDPSTAVRVGVDALARDALPHRTVQYRVPEEWGLREGDQVRLVDDEVGLDDLALVSGPPFVSEEGMTVTFRLPGAS